MPLFDPVHDAELLRKATKSSWSTDHKLLLHVVAESERSNEQMQELRQVFLKEYKKCPIEAVQKATNLPHQGAYSQALVATLLTREEFAAQQLYLAMAGLGTDERAMIQILAHSTKEEVELIKKTYLRMYSKTLEAMVIDDTSGKEKEFFVGLINGPRSHVDVAAAQDEINRDVKELYIAGQGRWSSDISAFVKIITRHDNEYLAALNLAYGRAYGDTLQRAVEKEVSNSILAKGMEAMIMDRADYYASELNRSITGAGTDTDTITRIIATQRHTMPSICQRYMTKYGKNLKQHLNQENAVDGTYYGKVLQSLLKVAEATGEKPAASKPPPQASEKPNKPPPEEPSKPPPAHSGPPPSLPGTLYAAPGYQPPPAGHGYPDLASLSLNPPVPAPGGPPPGYPPAPYGAPPPAPYGAPPPGYPPPPYGAPPPGAPPPGYPPAPFGAPPPGAPPPGYPPAPFGAPPPHGGPPPGYPPAPFGAPPPAPYGAPPPPYGAPPPGYPPAPYGAPHAPPPYPHYPPAHGPPPPPPFAYPPM